jgi:hypothetical protein
MAQAKEVFLFTPTSVPNCVMWFDAADPSSVIRTGTNVTQWNDKTGNGNTAVAGTATYPIYNTNTLNGNATIGMRNNNDYFLVSNNLTTTTYPSLCYFIVVRPASSQASTSYAGVLSTDTASAYGRSLAFGASAFQEEFYSGFNNITLYTAEQWYIVSLQFTTTVSATMAVNGATYAGTASGTGTNTTGFKIGSYNDSGSYATFNANFDVAEIMVYGADLTTSRRQQIEGYLAWKWGLQTSLSTSHPYRYYRPLANTPIPTQVPNMPIITQNVAAFIPTQISGCQLWLDGTDPTGTGIAPANGASLTQWKDKSSNRLTGTAISSPTFQTNIQNGQAVVRFNGTNQYIDFGNVLNLGTNGITVFMVTKYAINAGNQVGMVGKASYRGNPGRWAFVYDTVAGGPNGVGVDFFIDDTSQSLTGIVFNPGSQFNIFTAVNNRTSFNRIYANGSFGSQQTFTATANNLSNTDPLYVAAYPNGTGTGPQAGLFMNGDIAEILVYFSAFSDSQRQQVEGYLAWKWGLTANLPVGHPYRQPQIAPFPYRAIAFNGNEGFWRPTLISGCQLWLDAADPNGNGALPAIGTNISTWVDKSGSGNNATSAGSSVPTYNSRAVAFNGSGYYNTNYSAALASESFFMVYRWSTITADAVLIAGTQVNQRIFYVSPSISRWLYFGGIAAWGRYGTDALTTNITYLASFTWNFASLSPFIYLNGSTVSLSSVNSPAGFSGTPVTSQIGSGINGSVYEVIGFNVTLTTAQRQQVEGYLAWKWGLQGSLPAGHPYKLWPPPPS